MSDSISTIVNSSRSFNNNSQLSIVDTKAEAKRVDLLILDVQELIDQQFKLWFVKRFYKMSNDQVHRLASSVREQATYKPSTNPKRLFSWLVKQEVGF